MKRFYRLFAAGSMIAMLAVLTVQTAVAQDEDPKMKEYNAFLACRKDTDAAKRKACFDGAREFMKKYGADNDEFTSYVGKQLKKYDDDMAREALFNRFNNSIKNSAAVNADEAFAAGKEILAAQPDFIDVMLVMATVGYDKSTARPPVDKYNADTISIAKQAIQKIEGGVQSTTGDWGALSFSYKTKAYPEGKTNALGWMNYTISSIMFYNQKMKKEALPFLNKALTYNSGVKTYSEAYKMVGVYYLEEFVAINTKREELIKANGDKDNDETLGMLALQKGYAERAADAYGRAYKVAAPTATKEYKDALLNRSKEFYGIRYDKDMTGFDAFLAGTSTRSFPDPTSTVAPVAAPVATIPAATTPATTSVATTTPAKTTTTATTTKPAASTAAATTTPATTTATTKKTTVKKPVTKKKRG